MGHGGVLDDGGTVPQIGQSRGSNALLLGKAVLHDLEASVAGGWGRGAAVREVIIVVVVITSGCSSRHVDTLIRMGTAGGGRGGSRRPCLIEVETASYCGCRRGGGHGWFGLGFLPQFRLFLVSQLVFSQVGSPLEFLATLHTIKGHFFGILLVRLLLWLLLLLVRLLLLLIDGIAILFFGGRGGFFFGLCQRRWEARLAGQLNCFPHSGHLYSRSTMQAHLCRASPKASSNLILHNRHT